MGRQDLEGFLKITDRTITMVVLWKKALQQNGQYFKRPDLLNSVNAFIADLAGYRFELKEMLKGNRSAPNNETLALLLKQIEEAKDPDTRELYTQALLKLSKQLLNDGRLEVHDAAGEKAAQGND